MPQTKPFYARTTDIRAHSTVLLGVIAAIACGNDRVAADNSVDGHTTGTGGLAGSNTLSGKATSTTGGVHSQTTTATNAGGFSTSTSSGLFGIGGSPAATSTSTSPVVQHTAQERQQAALAIEQFLTYRDNVILPPATVLAESLRTQGFAATEVEDLIAGGPSSYPVLSKDNNPLGNLLAKPVSCYHVAYDSTYYQYVSSTYDPNKRHPLVVVGHGGNSQMSVDYADSTAVKYVTSYQELADGALGAVIVAPATTVGWNPIGDSLIEATISATTREFNIDPNRIYITGQSMGGHLTWRSAMNHGDRFAAFSPQSGGYSSYIDDHLIENVFGTFGYVTYGTTELYGLDATNDLLGAWLTSHKYPWTIVKKSGGHEIYGDEIGNIGAMFAAHTRNLYPERTYFHAVGELKYPDANTDPAYVVPGRSLRWNFRNWIEIDARPDLPTGATFYGENKGNNRLEITSTGVRHMNVLLHPKMVNMTTPVTIAVNGEVKYAAIPTENLSQLLERVREFDDRGRIYYASIPIDIASDKPVPTPSYQ
jgi:pimeloyl-ACP methyl ester carboxylesterase